MTLRELLFIQDAVQTADKWYKRWKMVENTSRKKFLKQHEVYTNWCNAEENLDEILNNLHLTTT